MASSKVTVSMDRAHLKARMQKAKDLAGYAVASQIQADCRPFTPHAEGILEASSRVESTLTAEGKEYSITWNTVYAAYQYYGCWPDKTHVIQHHNTDINKRATTLWVEAAKATYGSDWQKVVNRAHILGSQA